MAHKFLTRETNEASKLVKVLITSLMAIMPLFTFNEGYKQLLPTREYVKEVLNSNKDSLSQEVQMRMMELMEEGNYGKANVYYKDAKRENKILREIESELEALDEYIQKDEKGSAIDLIITIRDKRHLNYKFTIVSELQVEVLKRKLDSLRIKLYEQRYIERIG